MQIYYFSRTGRSKKIAEELAGRFGVTARIIDDNKNWAGKFRYLDVYKRQDQYIPSQTQEHHVL